MKRLITIIINLTISCNLYCQTSLEKHLNNSVIKDSINSLQKKFTNKDFYFDFKKMFQDKSEFTFIQKETLKSNNRKIHYFELKSEKQPNISEKLVFYTETANNNELINFFLFSNYYSDSINEIINRNYLSFNFNCLSHFPETQRSQRLDSVGRQLTLLFKQNKDTFIYNFFRPEICDNSIGDTWFMRNMEKKTEMTNVEYIDNFYDENLKCGIVKLSITFSNNDIESDILYFRNINNNYIHFQTSMNSDVLRCLK